MKRRSVIMIIMTFMLLTLVGVGFATWIITEPTKESTAEGNIEVEKVESKVAWQFEAYWVNEPTTDDPVKNDAANNIVFGTPKDKVEKAWLTNDTIDQENLTVYLFVKAKVETDENKKVEVGNNDYAKISLKAVVNAATEQGEGESTNTPADLKTYLGDLATVSVTLKGGTSEINELSSTDLKQGVVLKITFGWKYKDGATDVTTNPYTYFNGLPYSKENAKTAEDYLKALYSLLDNCSFKVVLTADVKTAQ